jgi:hypothetical protein
MFFLCNFFVKILRRLLYSTFSVTYYTTSINDITCTSSCSVIYRLCRVSSISGSTSNYLSASLRCQPFHTMFGLAAHIDKSPKISQALLYNASITKSMTNASKTNIKDIPQRPSIFILGGYVHIVRKPRASSPWQSVLLT